MLVKPLNPRSSAQVSALLVSFKTHNGKTLIMPFPEIFDSGGGRKQTKKVWREPITDIDFDCILS
jgi:hypothetical protein